MVIYLKKKQSKKMNFLGKLIKINFFDNYFLFLYFTTQKKELIINK